MSDFFKRHLITKLIVGGAFAALTIGSAIAITTVNKEVIIPNEGFITEYVEKNFSKNETTVRAKNNLGDNLAIEIEQEGIVLAKNDNNCLPLSKEITHVNVFGYDVMEWIISNSGSGSADGSSGRPVWGILDALDEKGITYNQGIIDYYK